LIKTHYCTPAFHGSFSLKYVLPALVPEMDYQNLTIQEGGMASMVYAGKIIPQKKPKKDLTIKYNLLYFVL